jgi:CheY-like chemotaxis protein
VDVPQLVDAMAALAWPVLGGVVLWKLFPFIKDIAKSRAFSIKVGNMELSVQEATEQLRRTLEDLQKKVEELRSQAGQRSASVASVAPVARPVVAPRRIVWVDDNPSNNAFEIARLRDDGVEIIELLSTEEAVRKLVAHQFPVRAVVSDMVRREDGVYNQKAGIALVQQLRSAGLPVPVFIYCSARALQRTRDEALAAGANGVTASSVELFELLQEALGAA